MDLPRDVTRKGTDVGHDDNSLKEICLWIYNFDVSSKNVGLAAKVDIVHDDGQMAGNGSLLLFKLQFAEK